MENLYTDVRVLRVKKYKFNINNVNSFAGVSMK